MAETLGSLCDKLTIVKLKQWHSEDPERQHSLAIQENQLKLEINRFIADAITGETPIEKLVFSANKVFKKDGNYVPDAIGNIGEVFSQLAEVNCKLWHEQEKVYEFEKIPISEKDIVVKQLALLNLERNNCIDHIDRQLQSTVSQLTRLENSKCT